jgi:hypothetical protein
MQLPEKFFIKTIHNHYHNNDPVFFNTDNYFWTKKLRDNTEKIIESLKPILSENYEGLVDNAETSIQLKPNLWKGYQFYFNGFKIKKNLFNYPYVEDLLSEIPYLISASISVLKPGAKILPHTGNTNGIMRYHLGLKIPAAYPECGMTINGVNISWQKGHDLMFCDMKLHSVQNLSEKSRYILLLDVVRPEFYNIADIICIHSTARILTDLVATQVKKIISLFNSKKTNSNQETISNEATLKANYYNKITNKPKSISLLLIMEKITLKIFIIILHIFFKVRKPDYNKKNKEL